MTAPSDVDDEEIKRALEPWRQGDCVVGKQRFYYPPNAEEPEIEYDEVDGLMVLTQTCDIVTKNLKENPFIEVCPLVVVPSKDDEDLFPLIMQGAVLRYAFVPSLEERRLVADLNRVMMVEKHDLVNWNRTEGCTTDCERRRLADLLARKRSRFAFPDEFVECVSALRKKIIKKHDKDSDDGKALRNLREIRVRADPKWDAEEVNLTFLFILKEGQSKGGTAKWDEYRKEWLKLVKTSDKFVRVDGTVGDLGRLTAKQYVESDQLDLGYLSDREPKEQGAGNT